MRDLFDVTFGEPRHLVLSAFTSHMPRPIARAPRKPPVDDLEVLIRSARTGDSDGLAGLYARYAVELFHTAVRLTGSQADAEDVVHDVFVGLPEALKKYEERGNFGAWLRRVAVRHTLMRMRRAQRRREVAIEDARLIDAHPRVDSIVDQRERRQMVEEAIRALPDGLREVFVLRHLEGWAHEDIAGLFGISPGASRVRLARALNVLRESLGKKF